MSFDLKMREQEYSEFPQEEYRRRVEKAMAAMGERGIDAMLLTTEENLRYFAGGPLTELFQDKFNDFFLLLPADPSIEASLVMSHHRQGPCLPSWVPEQRFWGYDPSGSLMEMSTGVTFVADVVKEKGLDGAVLGMEVDNGLRLGMTHATFQELVAKLPGATVVSAADIVWSVRAIKSAEEVAKIRKACHITCAAFEKGFEALRPGVTEQEVAAVIRASMFEQGATGAGFLAVYAGQERGIWADAIASDYQLQKGDLVMFDGGCCVDGYYADVSRQSSLGEPSTERRRLYELARQGNAEAIALVKPGAKVRDIFAAGQRPFRDAGLAANMVACGMGQLGHGIGLTLHELPDMRSDSDEQLQPGMVFAVEPAVQDNTSWTTSTYFFIVEDNVAVTERGCETLTPLPRELRIVSA